MFNPPEKNRNRLLIGYNTSSGAFFKNDPSSDGPAKMGKGVDWILCHMDPDHESIEENCRRFAQLAERIKELGIDFVSNFEFQNFSEKHVSSDGHDWCKAPDGCHRLNLPPAFIKALSSAGNCIGVMYDELEHIIMNENLSIKLGSKFRKRLPPFTYLKKADVFSQGAHLGRELKKMADEFKENGALAVAGEHVFPVLFHTFAKNGITPNFKSQKESVSNIQFACAVGAAKEYDTELWNCVDLWYRMTYPGHSAEEMRSNLLFSYLAGVDRVYVETSTRFYSDDGNGGETYNEYGKAFTAFADEYRGKDRGYSFRDYKPVIGIIKYDDGYFGQNDPLVWRPALFGNSKLRAHRPSKEWIRAFNCITHGESSKLGLSWDLVIPASLKPHRSFMSMNSAVVYDDEVTKEKLEGLELCFLCGSRISDGTLKAVSELVRENGLTVVAPKRLMPEDIKKQITLNKHEIVSGKGKWIAACDPASRRVKKAAAPYLGNKGEISLRFSDRTVVLKISENGETFEVMKEE